MNEFLRGRPRNRELPNFKPAFKPESEEVEPDRRKVIPNPGYQKLPVELGFDLRKLFSIIREDKNLAAQSEDEKIPAEFECYMVVFRSLRHGGEIDENLEALLGVRDASALDAARAKGAGLLLYRPGETDDKGYNLTLCIWESRDAALAVTQQKAHQEAAGMVSEVYEEFMLERYRVLRSAKGSLTLIDAKTDEVYAQIA